MSDETEKWVDRGFALFLGGAGFAAIAGVIVGLTCFASWTQARWTGPCRDKGGVQHYTEAQDYVFCANGERIDIKQSNGNTATYRVRVQ